MRKQNEADLEVLIAIQLAVVKRKLNTVQAFDEDVAKLRELMELRNAAPPLDPNAVLAAAASLGVAVLVLLVERSSVITQGALRLVTKIR